MRAMRVEDRGDVSVDRLIESDLPSPAPDPDQVLIQVTACAMCRTDLQIVSGDLPVHKSPLIPGHQVVGEIVEVGDNVNDARIGQQVGLAWIANACGICSFCLSQRENLCEQAKFTGWDVDGGYATQVLAQSDFAFDLSLLAGRDPLSIAPLMCAGVIGYRALRVAGIDSDSAGLQLGLYGYGASARQVLQIAMHWGVTVHVASRTSDDCEAALRDGADSVGLYDERPPLALDAAITFAPVGSVVIEALKSLNRGGTVAINAIHLDEIPAFNYDDLWWERSIRSIANVTRQDVTEFIDVVAAINLQTEFEVIELDQTNDALRRMRDGDVQGSFVFSPRTK